MLPKLGLYNFVSGASSPAGRGLPKVRTFLLSLVDASAGTSEPQFRCNRLRNLRIAARPFGNEQVHWQVMGLMIVESESRVDDVLSRNPRGGLYPPPSA